MILVVVSTGHFDALVEQCVRLGNRHEFYGQIGSSAVLPSFPYERTLPPSRLEKLIEGAELVVSHAGTGMLSMIYQYRKRAVVVPKQRRYGEANDGQVELARKWCELGMGVLCLDVDGLESAIETCRHLTPVFPAFPRLGDSLSRDLGISVELAKPHFSKISSARNL